MTNDNNRGMMDQGNEGAAATVSADQAKVLADAGLAKNRPGTVAGAAVTMRRSAGRSPRSPTRIGWQKSSASY
ncbi:MAG: hypothetical protein WCI74_11910 [Actinomycetes bacterium]